MAELVEGKRVQIASVYRDMFSSKKATLACHDEQWEFLGRHLPDGPGSKVLDAGCGNGKYTRAMIAAGYHETQAIDLFESAEESGLGDLRYQCASVAEAPFQDESFDFICSLSVIFYLDDPADALREFYRLLRPGGKVVISCHSRYSLFTLERVIKRWLKLPSAAHLRHIQFLSASHYKKLLEDAGFNVVEVDGFRASYLATQLRRVLRRFGLQLRSSSMNVPRSKFHGWLRATFGYHAVFAACKRPSNAKTVESRLCA